jgi:hypothetical protein
MQNGFTDMLAAACEALRAALDDCGTSLAGTSRLVQIGDREFAFDTVAAAHFPGFPIRRLILGAAAGLASARPGTAGKLSAAADEPTGLAALCRAYELRLRASLPRLSATPRFFVHDARDFRVRAVGPRNFHYAVPAQQPIVELIVDLDSRRFAGGEFQPQPRPLPDADVAAGARSGIGDGETVRAVFKYLAHREADVRIKVAAAPERFAFLPATVLDVSAGDERCVITAAGLDEVFGDRLAGDVVTLIFPLHGKLLEGSCRVDSYATGVIGDDLELPLLALALPPRLEFGQRRGAGRAEPVERLYGTVQRLDAVSAPVGRPLEVRILDLSATGLRAALATGTLVSAFKWGTQLVCEFALPEFEEPIRLETIVRRLTLESDPTPRRRAILGLEFTLPPDDPNRVAVRQYLANLDEPDGSGEVAVEQLLQPASG